MLLSLKVPDASQIHQLLRIGAVKDDYRVTLTDVTFLKVTENNHYFFRAKKSGQDVIVKFTYEDEEEIAIPRLRYESQIYVDHLKPLWGVQVPKFYGFYVHETSKLDELSCACIVLQYCGEPAVSDLSELEDYRGAEYGTKRFRNDTMDIVFRLHSPEIGLEHDELNASHILDLKGRPFLIDFTTAEPHHCLAWHKVEKLTREVLPAKEGEILLPLGPKSVKCYELWVFLESIDYCIPSAFDFHRTTIVCMNVTSAADLFERVNNHWPRVNTEQEMWNESVKHWRRIHSNWKKYHPDAVVEPPLGIIDFETYLKTRSS